MFNSYQQVSKKAIAYYRHSAEDKQENSIIIQRQHTEKFARDHNIEIIHEEADEGKSGLLANRPAFERLFKNWIENPQVQNFDYVLVYDVSRWGRFQDQDQAAYLVHLCKKRGKEVVYVSRGFPDNANKLISSLETSIQRYMAAEYSRQLSDKVFYGCMKVSEQGYSAGGIAVYGMARQLLDINKKPIRILDTGEHKQIANERVSFTPKNDETTETVKEIFDLFTKDRWAIHSIVSYLNRKSTLLLYGPTWDKAKIIRILMNEIYIGTHIYNKTWNRLKQKSHKNPRAEWVIVTNAFNSIVQEQVFKDAQERLYWMFSNNWRRGINAIKRAKKNIKNDILNWLLSKGATHFEGYKLLSELPIIFSLRSDFKNLHLWCFLISEQIRKFDTVLAISVIPERKRIIDDFFLLSVRDFTVSGFLILSTDTPLYDKSKIKENKIEDVILSLIKQFKTCQARNENKFQFVENIY